VTDALFSYNIDIFSAAILLGFPFKAGQPTTEKVKPNLEFLLKHDD